MNRESHCVEVSTLYTHSLTKTSPCSSRDVPSGTYFRMIFFLRYWTSPYTGDFSSYCATACLASLTPPLPLSNSSRVSRVAYLRSNLSLSDQQLHHDPQPVRHTIPLLQPTRHDALGLSHRCQVHSATWPFNIECGTERRGVKEQHAHLKHDKRVKHHTGKRLKIETTPAAANPPQVSTTHAARHLCHDHHGF